jgi:hypothetical protein
MSERDRSLRPNIRSGSIDPQNWEGNRFPYSAWTYDDPDQSAPTWDIRLSDDWRLDIGGNLRVQGTFSVAGLSTFGGYATFQEGISVGQYSEFGYAILVEPGLIPAIQYQLEGSNVGGLGYSGSGIQVWDVAYSVGLDYDLSWRRYTGGVLQDEPLKITRSDGTVTVANAFAAGTTTLGNTTISGTLDVTGSTTIGSTYKTVLTGNNIEFGRDGAVYVLGTHASSALYLASGGRTTSDIAILSNQTINLNVDQDVEVNAARTSLHNANYADYACLTHYDLRASATGYAVLQAPGGATFINHASGQATYFSSNTTIVGKWNSTGLTVQSSSNAAASIDVYQKNATWTHLFGSDETTASRTNSTRKIFRLGFPHYTNTEEPVIFATGDSDGANNEVILGGGTSIGNALTALRIDMASGDTTTSGTPIAKFTSTGLNIGSSDDPEYPLTVRGNAIADDGTNEVGWGLQIASGRRWWFGIDDQTTDKATIGYGTTPASSFTQVMTFDGGNVGIGTSSPDELAHISGSSAPTVRIENTDTTLVADQEIGSFEFEKRDTSGAGAGVVGGMRMYSVDNGLNTYMTFSTSNSTTNDNEVMRLTRNGNVGIGTSSPDQLLQVNSAATPSKSQFNVTANDLGSLSILTYAADNITLGFDTYYNAAWKSTDAGSSSRITKASDKMYFQYDTAAVGADLTWNTAMVIDLLTGVTQIGTPGTNYTEIEADGTLVFNGDATVWEDQQINISSVKLPTSSAPTWTSYKGSQVLAFDVGDKIYFTAQLSHKYEEDADIEFHIHYALPTDGDAANDTMKWEFTHSWSNINGTIPAETTVTTETNIENQVDDTHYLNDIASTITGSGMDISSILLCKLERVAVTTPLRGEYPDDIYLLAADFHIECNTVGSREVASK